MVNKGYKQTEVGVIPEDWELLLLGKAAKVYRGGSPRPIQSYITNSPNGVNWIKIGDVRENDKYIYSTQEKIGPDGIAMSREVHIGDFILSNSMSFGRPYILRTNGCIHDGWLTIQEYGHAFSTEYLYYLLSSKIIYKQYIGMAAGSSVKNLNKDKVSSLMVICPPLPEQQRIAEALSDVDGMISSLEKLIAKYKSIKTACLQQMFPQNGETVPRMRLPGFTGTWEQRKLEDIASDMVAGGDIDKDLILAEGQYPVIANALTGDGIVGYYDKEYRVSAPAVTVTGRGDVGHAKARLVNFTPVVRLLSVKSEHDVFFLENAINTLRIVIESTGVSQLTVPQLEKYEVAFPQQLDEEKQIGAFFKQLDNLITLHQRKLEKVQKIKQGMMQQLLTGKIRLV